MELLFSRYATPYIFLDAAIDAVRLHDFVITIATAENDRKLWEIYLAMVANPYAEVKSFDEFKKKHSPQQQPEINLEATVKESFDMLKGFHPERKAGGET